MRAQGLGPIHKRAAVAAGLSAAIMIKAVLIINTLGKPRLSKFYEYTPPDKQQQLIHTVYTVLAQRAGDLCSFVEDAALLGQDTKLVYRTFATLYFVFVVDGAESELAVLDLIQVFVETLDKCFADVCELDIVFNFPKVHQVLDEIIVGGLVVETDPVEIIKAITEVQRLERKPDPAPTRLRPRGGPTR